jgi:hypothetical protein
MGQGQMGNGSSWVLGKAGHPVQRLLGGPEKLTDTPQC